MAIASEQNKGTLAKWFNTLTSEQMARFLSDGQAVEDFLNSALYREDLFTDAIGNVPFMNADGDLVSVEQAVNRNWPRLTDDQMFGTTWRGERPPNSPIDAEDMRDIYVQEFLRRVAGVPTYEQADLNEDGRISQAEAAVDLEKLEELIASDTPGTRSDILGQVFGDYISPDNPLSEELIETLLGKIPNYDAAENVSVDDLTDEQKAAWELLKEDDRGMTTVGILAGIFGPDFDTANLNKELVNLVLRSWGKDFDDFQNDIMRDDKGGNNPGGNNPGGNIPGGNIPGGNNPGGNDDGNNDNDNGGGGMDLRAIWDWVTKVFGPGLVMDERGVFGPGLDPRDQSIIDLINIALGDQSQTTDVDATGGTSTSDATGGTSTSDSTSDSTSTVGDTTATGGNVGDTSATGGSVGDTTATGGAGGAGGQGGQASAAGGAGGQGGQAAGGAGGIGQGGIGQGGVGQGGSAAGGSVGDTTTGSQSIGDTITDVVNTFVQNAPDVVGAAIRDEIARKYEADQLKDASDAELALLRELMETREDVYAPFYSLGGVAPGPDGIFNTADDITYLDETLDEYRTAIKEPFDPRIDLMDERGTGQLVDPQPNQFNIAQMVSEVGRGALPDAMYSDVNQIDPFNPQDAGLRFLQDEGRRAIEASSAAAGRLNSGGTLAELQNQAIGTAAQYAQNLANIGQNQDTSRLSRDQQYYNQLLGNQEQLFGQDLEQLAAMQLAQDAQDRVQLAADTARFESGQNIGQQKFNQASAIAEQDYGLANRPANALASLLGMSESGASGLTGGDSGYLQAGYGSSAGSPYSGLGDISLKNDDNKIGMLGNILGNIFK